MTRDHSEDFFSPPLWRQRRSFILDHLLRFKASSVLDYGCGEASVLSFLIPPSDPPILRMAGVDLDMDVLEEAVERCVPWDSDFKYRRTHPLTIDIYHGSIDAIDQRLEGYEAIICSEVIEHVHDNVLDKFFAATMGHYQPNVLIVTTPNGEYNVNFPDLKYGTSEATFRHDDHKFEWTRKQFETWCQKGANQYGYSIEFHGIGLLNSKLSDLSNGHCTQACIFTRNTQRRPTIDVAGQPHTLMKHIEFPYYDEPPLKEEEIREEVETYIESLCIAEDYYRKKSDCVKPPTPPSDEESEESEESLCWTLNWNTDDDDDDDSTIDLMPATPQAQYTISPIQLPVSCLWDVLRLRQICRTKQRLLNILHSYDSTHYEVVDEELVIKRAFVIPNETQSVCHSPSEEEEEEEEEM